MFCGNRQSGKEYRNRTVEVVARQELNELVSGSDKLRVALEQDRWRRLPYACACRDRLRCRCEAYAQLQPASATASPSLEEGDRRYSQLTRDVLVQKLRRKTAQLRELRQRFARLERAKPVADGRLLRLVSELRVMETENPQLFAVLADMIATWRHRQGQRHCDEVLQLCQSVGLSYEKVDGQLPLPSQRLVGDAYHYAAITNRHDPTVGELAASFAEERAARCINDRHVLLYVDGMKITPALELDASSDAVTGYVDVELATFRTAASRRQAVQNELAGSVQQVLAGSYTRRLDFVMKSYGCGGGEAVALCLLDVLLEHIAALEDAGFVVDGLVCDGAAENRSMFRAAAERPELGPVWAPHPLDPRRKLLLLSDGTHCVKKLRNQFARSFFAPDTELGRQQQLRTNGVPISWGWVALLVQRDTAGFATARLTEQHVNLSTWSKMKQTFAFDVFRQAALEAFQRLVVGPLERQAAASTEGAAEKLESARATLQFMQHVHALCALSAWEAVNRVDIAKQHLQAAKEACAYLRRWRAAAAADSARNRAISRETVEDVVSWVYGLEELITVPVLPLPSQRLLLIACRGLLARRWQISGATDCTRRA